MRYRFRVTDRTRRASHDMIQMMAKHGNNPHTFVSDADVKRFFASAGYDYVALVEECRKMDKAVPLVENLIQSTWSITDGVSVAIVDMETGLEEPALSGPGTLVSLHYWGRFEDAARDLRHALQTVSVGALQSCLSSGIASIEAYIAHRTSIHSRHRSSLQLIDTKEHKVRFDTKIDEWIPIMSGGKELDKSRQNWAHF